MVFQGLMKFPEYPVARIMKCLFGNIFQQAILAG